MADRPTLCDKGGADEPPVLTSHDLPTVFTAPNSDKEDNLSTLASVKTSDPDKDDDDSSDYKDANWDTVTHTPDKRDSLARNPEMESDASDSVISTASKTSRHSRCLIMRNQAATPVWVYNTRFSIDVRHQGGDWSTCEKVCVICNSQWAV